MPFPILYPTLVPNQQMLPGFERDDHAVAALNWRWIGRYGEWLAASLLKASGFEVQTAQSLAGDLRAVHLATGQVVNIEVKTSRAGVRGYGFCLRRTLPNRVCTDVSHADFVILLPILSSYAYPFVVPVSVFGSVKQFSMTASPLAYSGKLARFANFSLPLVLHGVNDGFSSLIQ